MFPGHCNNPIAPFQFCHTTVPERAVAVKDPDNDIEEKELSSSLSNNLLNWKLYLTEFDKKCVPFHQHLQCSDTSSSPASVNLNPKLADHPFKLQLSTELQLCVLDFCSDRMTLFRLMHVSSFLRAEASKIFWADPDTYYSVDASWLIAGGYPGHIGYSMSFLSRVQNIELEYGDDASRMLEPEGMDGVPEFNPDVLDCFWEVLKRRFPSVKRVVVNHTTDPDLYDSSTCCEPLVKACSLDIEVSILCDICDVRPNLEERHKYASDGQNIWSGKVLARKANDGKFYVTASLPDYKTVLIPMRKFCGPVGEYEKADYLDERIELQRRGLGATMIKALDQWLVDNEGPKPFRCPAPHCDQEYFTSHFCMQHVSYDHGDELMLSHEFGGWPEELKCIYERRHLVISRLLEENATQKIRIQQEWDEAGEHAKEEIKKVWMEQLENDPDWDTGVPAKDSSLWKRFEAGGRCAESTSSTYPLARRCICSWYSRAASPDSDAEVV